MIRAQLLGVDCFSALPSIFPNGNFSMNITAPPCAMAPCSVGYANATFTIPTGRWTTVRLEVNTESVGMSDGYALLYVDGSLAASIEGVKWRREGNPASGVKTRSLPGAKRQVIDAVDPERWSGMWHEIGVMGVIARERSVWLTGHEIEVLA